MDEDDRAVEGRAGRGAAAGCAGRVAGTFFGGLFVAAGLFFCVMVVYAGFGSLKTRSWVPTRCRIVRSEAVRDGVDRAEPYTFRAEFVYEAGGRERRSERVMPTQKRWNDYGPAGALARRFPAGDAECLVNPDDPAEAVLLHDRGELVLLLFLPLPLLFVGIGGAMMVGSWWGAAGGRRGGADPGARRGAGLGARLLGGGFFSAFALLGGGIGWGMFVGPVLQTVRAAGWQQTPCVVLASDVLVNDDGDGTTYKVDVFYEYRFGGRQYRSSRYSFLGMSSSGRRGKQKVVNRYRPGDEAVCFVNPREPSQAALYPYLHSGYWFGLLPLVFLIVGVGGVIGMVSGGGDGSHSGGARKRRRGGADGRGPRVLRPRVSATMKAVGMLFLALFWNGMSWGFAILTWREKGGFSFFHIFISIFLLVGLGIAAGAVYSLLAMFNPRPQIRILPGAPRLGEAVAVEWRFVGRTDRMRRLDIVLEGREEATYTRGTDTCTDKEVFRTLDILHTTDSTVMRHGKMRLDIPADTMHSFDAQHNKVIWVIKVSGDIPNWPDINDEFTLEICALEEGR